MRKLNVLYGIDEGKKDYSRYLGVSIMSLLEKNKDENIYIYINSQQLDESNKEELIRIVESYGKKIQFSHGEIVPKKYVNVISYKGGYPISTYYRRFFEKFDIEDRILYLDCDTIINKNLSEFYDSDFEGNVIIGQPDTALTSYYQKKKYGLKKYINNGVILINVNLFKKTDLYSGILRVNEKFGLVDFCDQGYTNIIFNDKIKLHKNLQCILERKRENYNLKDYLVLHTVRKPNEGGYGFCKSEIESIFNEYLSKTKRKNYVGYKKSASLVGFFGYLYSYITFYLSYISLKIFGPRCSNIVLNVFTSIGTNLGKFYRRILN